MITKIKNCLKSLFCKPVDTNPPIEPDSIPKKPIEKKLSLDEMLNIFFDEEQKGWHTCEVCDVVFGWCEDVFCFASETYSENIVNSEKTKYVYEINGFKFVSTSQSSLDDRTHRQKLKISCESTKADGWVEIYTITNTGGGNPCRQPRTTTLKRWFYYDKLFKDQFIKELKALDAKNKTEEIRIENEKIESYKNILKELKDKL